MALSQTNSAVTFVAADVPSLQTRAPTGKTSGPSATLLESRPTTFQVIDSIVSDGAPTTAPEPANAIVAPFPAVVAEVPVEPGQTVDGADPVVVIEAMKMLHTLTAGGPGVVAEVRVAPGEQVETNQILVTFEEGSDNA